MLSDKRKSPAGQTAAMVEEVKRYFVERGYERVNGKFNIPVCKLEDYKGSVNFLFMLAAALDGDDIEESVKGVYNELYTRGTESPIPSLVRSVLDEVSFDESGDVDFFLSSVLDSIVLDLPYQEHLDELYFVRIQLSHLDIGAVSLERSEVSLDELRGRNQLCGEIRYESAKVSEDGPSPRPWDIYADISLRDVIRFVRHFRFCYGSGDDTLCLPAGTVILREGHPTQGLTTALEIPFCQIEMFSLGWYED